MGITTLFLFGYIVVIGIFGNVDISRFLPIKLATTLQEAWPQMPFFTATQEPAHGGKVTYYTVPTRQFTPQELARMRSNQPGVPPAKASKTPPATSAPAAR